MSSVKSKTATYEPTGENFIASAEFIDELYNAALLEDLKNNQTPKPVIPKLVISH